MTSSASALAAVQALLRTRNLDRTLTSVTPVATPGEAPFAHAALDAAVRGGLPRGQVSEVVGPVSSGRTSLAWAALAAASHRGEWVALVDTFDRFDPVTAAACGIDLPQLLWVRGQALSKTAAAVDPAWVPGRRAISGPGTLLERTVDRALKSLNLIVQSGVCTLVVLDLVDVPATSLSRVPPATWLRIQRVVEGSDTAVVLLAAAPVARSAGGLSMVTGGGNREAGGRSMVVPAEGHRPLWKGTHDRSRRLGGLATRLRATSPRGHVGAVSLAFEP